MTAYCTILARNYLPRALMLADSLREHGSEHPLVIFLIDLTPEVEMPEVPGVRWMGPSDLDVPARDVLDMAMSYDLVEFATAVKPPLLKLLLREHEEVVYLDPDTYVTSPMVELSPALSGGAGIVLTPHYLEPTPEGNRFTEGHLLHVGVYNLGFCAVNRSAGDFLDWWWGHLRSECLLGPLDNLFVDQKWVDPGAVLFGATTLRHYGYNVGAGNLHERPLARDEDGYYIATNGDRLRLFHFHAFDPQRPTDLYGRPSTKQGEVTAHSNDVLDELAHTYAAGMLEKQRQFGDQPDYVYWRDQSGRRISRRMRRAYRAAALAKPGGVPSPFVASEADAYERWRRSAMPLAGKLMLSDLAKGTRCALPEEYYALKRTLPGLTRSLRNRYIENTGRWG